MDILIRQELFEIGVLKRLKNAGFLEPLVFGGGTALRLCYELNRYSADLDFWFVKKTAPKAYFNKLKKYLAKFYELTDAQMKFYTLLLELRSANYPKRLKIEIRRKMKQCDFQDRIAFSRYSTEQVLLRTHTLQQAMKNKLEAALQRKDIRDFFDLEFLLRAGVVLDAPLAILLKLKEIAEDFTQRDFKVTLGSVLEPKMRKYYTENKFDYLLEKIRLATQQTHKT